MKKLFSCLLALSLLLSIALPVLAEQSKWKLDTDPALNVIVDGVRVYGQRAYNDDTDTEAMSITCSTRVDGVLWTRTLRARQSQGFTTEVFIGGTPDDPRVMLYTSSQGLACCDLRTGDVEWRVARSKVDLGESISHAVASDGTLYIGGGFGPDPVAISPAGKVLWRADAHSEDTFWLDGIKVGPQGIAAHYGHLLSADDGDPIPGWLLFGTDGTLLDGKRD